jgi:hypothetical protein
MDSCLPSADQDSRNPRARQSYIKKDGRMQAELYCARDEMRRLMLNEEAIFHFPFVICHFRVSVTPEKSETAQMISFADK